MARTGRRALVEQRAGFVCEYCKAPQGKVGYVFHIDHVIPRHKGGTNDISNLVLSCASCNLFKSAHTAGVDGPTDTTVSLYNPCQQIWSEHFEFDRSTGNILGVSAVGRVTAERLGFNVAYRVKARLAWIAAGWIDD